MLPTEKRILEGARKTVAELKKSASSSDQELLIALDTVLTELILRNDRDFYLGHYRRACELADQGLDLVRRFITDTSNQVSESATVTLPDEDDSPPEQVEALRQTLKDLVLDLAIPTVEKEPEIEEFLSTVVDWENGLLVRHHQIQPAEPPESRSKYFTTENLEKYLQLKYPECKNPVVDNLEILTGGFSKTTVLFDVKDDLNGQQSLVVRAEQPPRYGFWPGDMIENEFSVLQLVHEAGLCIPEPLWLEEDRSHLNTPFLVSRRSSGENPMNSGAAERIDQDILEDVVRQLVAIHTTELDPQDSRIKGKYLERWANFKTLQESTTAWVDHWIETLDNKELRPSPLATRTLAWLKNNVPDCTEKPSLLHGDFGLHNVLVENNKVTAILDWEYLMFGDPANDISMLFFTLGGHVSKDEIMQLYYRFGGREISEYRLRYFDVISALKYIACAENSLKNYQEYGTASFKLAHFGLVFPYTGVSTLNDTIAQAEKVLRMENH